MTDEEIESSIEDFNPYTVFGSMGKAMLTLFSIAILVEWPEIARPISMKQPVLMMSFGLINVTIGEIVDSVMARVDTIKVRWSGFNNVKCKSNE